VHLKSVVQHKLFGSAFGAVLTMLCGLALWQMTLGERWVNASYDYLFRFGARGSPTKSRSSSSIMRPTIIFIKRAPSGTALATRTC
jgi:hypothetical protein